MILRSHGIFHGFKYLFVLCFLIFGGMQGAIDNKVE